MPRALKKTEEPSGPLGDMFPYRDKFETYREIPKRGRNRAEILHEMRTIAKEENARWQNGKISGTYYHGGMEHYAFLNQIFSLYSHVNLLQRDMCPSGTKFEGEIIAMTARMLGAEEAKASDPNADVCGAITSGGTESIILPMLAYREKAKAERGITAPEMVVPDTIHPAFSKGAHFWGINLIRVPVGPDYLADVEAMRAAITPNTIAIAGSAANYPHGLIDPIEKLSALALEKNLPMHVDSCFGGYILPWISKLGYDIPKFDFRLPGVTSMSCDTHKWGYGLKGASVVLFRNKALRRKMYFALGGWQGGLYASPTVAGSRSEGISASTWAAIVALGQEGYLGTTRRIMKAADTIKAGAAKIPEIKIIGKPTYCIAFTSDVLNIYHVNDYLARLGWRLNGLQKPAGFHICVTLPQTLPGVATRFVKDLAAGVEYAKNPPASPPKSGAVYGGGAAALDPSMINELMYAWLDASYELP
ncbi:MAG TPA: aminotransferase class V-fold PLP-dependent enzyme [Candidatus Binataceae bacterium]|nr:aminotransferase class V-fold PLP-dependent enzyme [Candidatus Binataceae bacterium]